MNSHNCFKKVNIIYVGKIRAGAYPQKTKENYKVIECKRCGLVKLNKFPKLLLELTDRLKIIVTATTGLDHIDLEYTTKKNIAPITTGETIFPKNNPNLNQRLFNGVSIFALAIPNIRKIIETANDHILIFPSLINGHKAIIKKNVKKTIPKLLFELILIFFINIY